MDLSASLDKIVPGQEDTRTIQEFHGRQMNSRSGKECKSRLTSNCKKHVEMEETKGIL